MAGTGSNLKRTSHKPRSMDLLRQHGLLVADVERRSFRFHEGHVAAGKTHDLYGLGDLLVCGANQPPQLIQVCSESSLAAHRSKALAVEHETHDGKTVRTLPYLLGLPHPLGFAILAWGKTPAGRWRARLEPAAIHAGGVVFRRAAGVWSRQRGGWAWVPD